MGGTVESIYRHPVKGLTPEHMSQAPLTAGAYFPGDRAYAIENTEMFAPRYIHHQITQIRVTGIDAGIVNAEAAYTVLETLIDEPTRILQCGRYYDKFVRHGDGLLLKERRCIYDTLIVPTCVVYPV